MIHNFCDFLNGKVLTSTWIYWWNCSIVANVSTTLTSNHQEDTQKEIPVSEFSTIVYRKCGPQFSLRHPRLSVYQYLPSSRPLNAKMSKETRSLPHTGLPSSDILLHACHIGRYTHQCRWRFPSLCFQIMVCCNSSSIRFLPLHFHKTFNHVLGCRLYSKATDVLCHSSFNTRYPSVNSTTPSSCFGPCCKFFTLYALPLKTFFKAVQHSCAFYRLFKSHHCVHILALASIPQWKLEPVIRITDVFKHLVSVGMPFSLILILSHLFTCSIWVEIPMQHLIMQPIRPLELFQKYTNIYVKVKT